MLKLFLGLLILIASTVIYATDPLDEIDGTESWYEGTMEGKGDIVYYNEAYEKDMKIYLAYLKAKQKSKTSNKNLSSKLNKKKKKYEEKDDEIGELGSLKDEDKLSDDLMNENDKKEVLPASDKENKNDENNEDDDLLDDDLD